MRISDWSSDVCSSDLGRAQLRLVVGGVARVEGHGHPHHRHRGAAGEDDGDAVFELRMLDRGEFQILHRLYARFGALGRRRRSEERRVGKAWVSTFRSRRSPDHDKKNTKKKLQKQNK